MTKDEAKKFLDAAGNVDARKVRRSVGGRTSFRNGTKRAAWQKGKYKPRRKLVSSQKRSQIMAALRSTLEIVIAPQGDSVLAN